MAKAWYASRAEVRTTFNACGSDHGSAFGALPNGAPRRRDRTETKLLISGRPPVCFLIGGLEC